MSQSISLDELVALNDEIAGLVRSGLPLEMGLRGWGQDLSGPLKRTVSRLAEETAGGRNLTEALADAEIGVPPVYRAVVAAGLRSGRLPSALESVARTARSLRETRAAIGMAVLYPLVLLLVGYGLFMLLAAHFIAIVSAMYESRPPALWSVIADAGSFVRVMLPIPGLPGYGVPVACIPPLVIVGAAVVWWFRTRRAIVVDGGNAARWLAWVPLAGRVLQHARWAALAEILGLLIEHDVPVQEAIVLAADSTGDRRLIVTARRAAEAFARGAEPGACRRELVGFPPLLGWLIASPASQQTLVAMARHVADVYRRSVARDAIWLRDMLPVWLVATVGTVVVTAYALSIFVPFTDLLRHLGAAGQSLGVRP